MSGPSGYLFYLLPWYLSMLSMMATMLLSRRAVLSFHSNRWQARINNNLAKRCDLQCSRNLSFKLLSKLSKDIKKQLADVKILSNLRVSFIIGRNIHKSRMLLGC
jgi:hypothetical protein